jgi:hypothetical protein
VKGLDTLMGLMQGLKLGTVQSLDTMSDEHVSKIMYEAVKRMTASVELAAARQKRLLGLLRDAVVRVHGEL